ncbi:MAG: L-threonylcarbamoyladenylate synthase [Dehalococcoidia bacterium]
MPIVPAEALDDVLACLRAGGVAAIPTDTVYGLAVLADDASALTALAALKGRAADQPIAVLIDSLEAVAPHLEDPARLDSVAPVWPGALTAVVRARPGGLAAPVVTEAGTIGVRMPDDALARAVIRSCGGVLAVTSANRHGEPPALSAAEVARAFGDLPVLDGGSRDGGVASTVVDLTGEQPRVLREGPVTAAMLGIEERA